MKIKKSCTDNLAKVAINKSLLKEYSNSSNDRIVYMNDGTEFQIQLFNPYDYVIGVSFSFNENDNIFSNSNLLVLRPGERVWLDRYLDNESRLLFSTYEVGTSKAVKEAIKNNGNLCIKFYKEKKKIDNMIYITNIPWTPYHCDIYYNNPYSYSSSVSDLRCSSNCASTAVNLSSISTNTSITGAASSASDINNNIEMASYTRTMETGRIEEGSHSNQKFENINKDFECWPFKTENIKLLPTSQKQITSNDLQKRYCHQCGRKLNQKYKFCPFCGEKIN